MIISFYLCVFFYYSVICVRNIYVRNILYITIYSLTTYLSVQSFLFHLLFFLLSLIPPYFSLNSIATNLHTCKSERKPTILLDLTIELKQIFFSLSLSLPRLSFSLQFPRRIIMVIFRSNYQLAIARDSIALTLTRTCLS